MGRSLNKAIGILHGRFGAPPSGGFCTAPRKGGTPNGTCEPALRMRTTNRTPRLAIAMLSAALACTPLYGRTSVSPAEMAEARRWAAAKFDGVQAVAANLPMREGERLPYSTEPPFSFSYGGQGSEELLKAWPCQRTTRKLDDQRTERTSVWTDPKTGLQVRCAGIEYADFSTVEWVV